MWKWNNSFWNILLISSAFWLLTKYELWIRCLITSYQNFKFPKVFMIVFIFLPVTLIQFVQRRSNKIYDVQGAQGKSALLITYLIMCLVIYLMISLLIYLITYLIIYLYIWQYIYDVQGALGKPAHWWSHPGFTKKQKGKAKGVLKKSKRQIG